MRKNTVFLLCAIFIIALAVRIASYVVLVGGLSDGPIPKTDAVEYDLLARNIKSGIGFRYGPENPPTAFRPPLYPLFIASIYSVFGNNYTVLRMAQFVLSAFCCCIVWYLACLLTENNRRVAFLAAMISIVYPSMFYHSGFFLTESLYIFLILASCCALARLQGHASLMNRLLSGIALALLCLVRPNAVFFVLFLSVWALLVFGNVKKAMGIYLSVIIVFLLALSPWMIRNYVHFKKLVPFSSNGGINLWGANNPRILGGGLEKYEAWEGGIIYDVCYLPGSEDLEAEWGSKDFDQFEVDRRCRKLAFDYLRNNPQDIPRLLANKFKRFWSVEIRNNPWERAAFILFDQGMIPFAILGFFVSLRYRKPPHLLLFLLLSVQASSLVFFANTRMRVGIAPSVVIYAAIGFGYIFNRMPNKRDKITG